MQNYILMHKDTPCAAVVMEDDIWKVAGYHTVDPSFTPFLGNCDRKKFSRWWEMRAVPASRELMKRVMTDAGFLTPEGYLAKNLALSMTDTYWVCPEEAPLHYSDVSFLNLIRHGGKIIPYHNASSFDPNASLGGQMNKYWDLNGDIPVLVKESYKYYGQQALNEVFATKLHERQNADIPFVHYSAERTEDGGMITRCNAFTSEHAELISAYEVIESEAIPNHSNNYNAYIDILEKHGIDRQRMQDFMDYQTLTDFIISNTDEHLLNFGVLRDPDTMKLIGPAPIYDSGNSMFYDDNRIRPYSRAELLERKITGFYKTEEKMLFNVKNPSLIRIDLLPTPKETKNFYSGGGIPEGKAEFIARNYETKICMLDDLQHGMRLSLYHEKNSFRKR